MVVDTSSVMTSARASGTGDPDIEHRRDPRGLLLFPFGTAVEPDVLFSDSDQEEIEIQDSVWHLDPETATFGSRLSECSHSDRPPQ